MEHSDRAARRAEDVAYRPDRGPQRPDLLARFRREAQAVGRLSHPHIVTIHDYGDQDGTPFLVMEYIAGHELAHDLARSARARNGRPGPAMMGSAALQDVAPLASGAACVPILGRRRRAPPRQARR